MSVRIQFVTKSRRPRKIEGSLIIGRASRLQDKDVLACLPAGADAVWDDLVSSLKASDGGVGTGTWIPGKKAHRLGVGVLPTTSSRHNAEGRPDAIGSLVSSRAPRKGDIEIIVALEHGDHALAAACAVVRAYPTYSEKSSSRKKRTVSVLLLAPTPVRKLDAIQRIADAMREAGALVDMPASVLHVTAFTKKAKKIAKDLGAKTTVIAGKKLDEKGFGGLWGVGKAAVHEPALVVLSHRPAKAKKNIVWVGKGIVYDTGGLSIKTKAGMPGMKGDMGGAAAVMMAFKAAVENGFSENLDAVLCLAENSVGPEATRPDDILKLYSGKTVEVNNTDAEGRLVLGDGVAYAVAKLKPTVIVDLATLTGAQLMATGRNHAAVVCNDEELENAAVRTGKSSGDLVFPLPYCPEFYRGEFKSEVADMKNSVKDRMNAQTSCAGQFIADHLGKYTGPWLHVDLAGPSFRKGRGTGFGVALLTQLFAGKNSWSG